MGTLRDVGRSTSSPSVTPADGTSKVRSRTCERARADAGAELEHEHAGPRDRVVFYAGQNIREASASANSGRMNSDDETNP